MNVIIIIIIIKKVKVKLATVVEGDRKAPFSIAPLHQGVGEGTTPFPGLTHFILALYLIMLSVKQ